MNTIITVLLFTTFLVVSYSHGDHHDHRGSSLSCEHYALAYKAIDDYISNPSFSKFAIQGIVRLSFHDCVGKSCDGCINPNDDNNNGLQFRSSLDTIYDKSFRHMSLSRADFYALAGHVALIRGLYNAKSCYDDDCPSLFLDYKWGRKDCASSPNTTSIDGFPDSQGDFSEVWRVLNGMFGLEMNEVVALMGGHSLGGAHQRVSGFNFNWQTNTTSFNNQYYKNMLSKGYSHYNVGNGTRNYEFVRKENEGSHLMLNVDMAMLKHITAAKSKGEYTGHVDCKTKHGYSKVYEKEENFIMKCQNAKSASMIDLYANDVQMFYDDFSTAWAKMVSNGYPLSGRHALSSPGDEGEVCGSCIPGGSSCVAGYSKSGACCEGFTCEDQVCQ